MVEKTFLQPYWLNSQLNILNIKQEIINDAEDDENYVYIFETLQDFECCGDEVLVECSPPASPAGAGAGSMATARRAPAHLTQDTDAAPAGCERDLIVIPEIPAPIQLHTMQQVEVIHNGDSSGQSSPNNTDGQHTYIAVATGEGGNGVNYVQYVDQGDMYNQTHQYPVYQPEAPGDWGGGSNADYTALGRVVAGDEAEAPASPATPAGGGGVGAPPRMPPATVQWLLDHYETAEGVSLPRSTLYSHYLRHCAAHRLDPVNAASFGKLIRSVFVGLRTRRLGTRGNSKYHYYGIRAKADVSALSAAHDSDDHTDVDQEANERTPESSPVGAASVHRQYLGVVTAPDPPELVVPDLPQDIPHTALQALRRHHRQHGVEFLEAVAALDTAGVERTRRAFWRRPPPDLCRRTLLALANRKDVADWLRQSELELYQRAVELLLPDVLRPIPPQLTQSIRNFAKSLESALATGSGGPGGAPPPSARAQAAAAGALSGALRRYTSLNHLAQAARAVLTNHHQIQQMLADLNRVDFRVVREQAAWACSCPSAGHAKAMEADFKAYLGRGATLEQWARWLEECVSRALAPFQHAPHAPHYTAKARKLLLDWSFYSSLVIRELTLRSAASFGSFHLIRLLYDEYVSYLVEQRVAAHRRVPPIAVMQRAPNDDDEEEAEANGAGAGAGAGPGGAGATSGGEEAEADEDPDDPEWEWADDDDEEDDDCKRPRTQ